MKKETLLCSHLDDAVFLFYEGVGFRKIGKLYNTSGEGVRQLFLRRGIDTSNKKKRKVYNKLQKITIYQKKQFLKLYYEGIPNREIAEKFNVSQQSVIVSLKELGIINVIGYHSQENFMRAKKFTVLFNEGKSLNSIGVYFDVPASIVKYAIIKELGKKKYNEIMSKRNTK